MPGGSSGGAQGFGRFYRTGSLTIGATETVIPFDTVSAFNPNGEPIQVALNNGDIKSSIAGVSVGTIMLHLDAGVSAQSVTIRAYHVLPNDAAVMIAEKHCDVPASSEPLTYECIFACALDVDSRIRFTARCGIGSHAVQVGAENETWAYVVIG